LTKNTQETTAKRYPEQTQEVGEEIGARRKRIYKRQKPGNKQTPECRKMR
jgi:hypothetical protein